MEVKIDKSITMSAKQLSRVTEFPICTKQAELASSVECTSPWYADGRRFDPPVRQHFFVELLSLSLIQVRRFSYWQKDVH